MKYIYMIYSGVVLAFLMVLTLIPVEQRWAQTDVVLIVSLPIILITGVVMRLGCRRRIQLSAIDLAVVVWMLYFVGRTWVGAEYPCRTEFLKVSMMFLLYATLRMSTSIPIRWLVVAVVVCGMVEAIWGLWQMMMGTSRHGLFLITGSFNNPGPYSAYLVMAATAAMLEYGRETNRYMRCLYGIAAAMCLVALPATWSRAAFVSLAICLLWIYRRKYWRYRYALWGVLAIAGIIFYYFKQGSADGRMIIWQAALTSWLSSPWFGVGTGGFCYAVSEGIAKLSVTEMVDMDSAGVTNYSYNSLVSILTEQGIVGLSVCLITVGIVMWRMRNESRALFFAILSLLIFSLFSYPFELLPYRMIVVLAVLVSEEFVSEKRKVKSEKYLAGFGNSFFKYSFFCLLFVFFFVFIFLLPVHNMVKDGYEADKEYATFRGMTEEIFLEDYRELLPLEEDNAEFLFDYAQALRTAMRYNDSNEMLRRGVKVSADPMFYVIMGNNYKDMTLYNMAEYSYNKAYAVMPNRIYPLYQLMLLYRDKDEKNTIYDLNKAKEVARRIVKMKPKIKSPATDEMKRKAVEMLQEQGLQ